MIRLPRRPGLLVLSLVWIAAACGENGPRREQLAATPDLPGAPTGSFASASVSASSAPTDVPPAEPVVRTPVPTPAPVPIPLLDAYVEEVDRRCTHRSEMTTQGMVDASIDAMNCRAKIMDEDAAKVGPTLSVFLDADPSGPHAHEGRSPSLWSKTADAACRIELAQATYKGAERYAGTFASVAIVDCVAAADRRLGALLRARGRDAADDAATYVRNVAAARVPPRARLARWQRYAAVARTTAPHYAASRCRSICRLADADWIDLEADIVAVLDGADRLGVALCASWPELATAFGQASTCASELIGDEADFRTVSDPAPTALPTPVDPELAPPADPAYAASLLAQRLTWTRTVGVERAASSSLAQRFADPRLENHLLLRKWMTDVASFRDRLSVIDSHYDRLDPRHASTWTRRPLPDEGPTARLLESYLVELILDGATSDLAAHVRAREAWGLAIEKNLRAASASLGLLVEGPKLGAALCDAAPELVLALGATDCARVATSYLFSMADTLGEPRY